MQTRKIFFSLLKLLTVNYYFKRKQKNSLLILMFHQVNDKKATFYPAMPVLVFENLCHFIKSNYHVIRVSEIKSHFQKTSKPAAIISFDDAHYDIIQNALPILSKFGMPFNVNIDTEILETGKPQDFVRVYDILNNTKIESYINPKYMTDSICVDRRNPILTENKFTQLLSNLTSEQKREVTEDLAYKSGMNNLNFSKMLTKEDVKYLCNYDVDFGSHSHTHPILTNINIEEVGYELSHSKDILESITQQKIDILAYPNGIYNENVEKIAHKIGYSTLLQTDDEINNILPNNNSVNSYKRVNQYHQSLDESKAHTYGILRNIKKLIS